MGKTEWPGAGMGSIHRLHPWLLLTVPWLWLRPSMSSGGLLVGVAPHLSPSGHPAVLNLSLNLSSRSPNDLERNICTGSTCCRG